MKMKRVRLTRRWRIYKAGAIVGPIQPNIAATLVRRGMAEFVDDDPPAKVRRRRKAPKSKTNGQDTLGRTIAVDHDG
jgi:hypothetical protein